MNNILITSAGQRVSLVKAFQKELREFDRAGKVFTVDLNPKLAAACHVSDEFYPVPSVTSDQYIPTLINLCKRLGVRMIVPTIDTELATLSRNIEVFYEQGIHCIVSDLRFIDACRDKRIINQFFVERGVEIPQIFKRNNLTFPLFVKPFDGSLSKDTAAIFSVHELTNTILDNPKLMFMEYMNPANYDEYTVDVYYDKTGKVKCIVPRRRIFVRAGEVNKGVTEKNEIVEFIRQKLNVIEGARGCLTMQFFLGKSNRRIVGIEINSRFGGGFPLSYKSGANYPGWLINEYFENKQLAYFDGWEDRLLMLRYDDEILVHGYEG